MIVLDTNVISEFTRPQPSERVQVWFQLQDIADLASTAVTEAELYYGVERMPDGKRKVETSRAVRIKTFATFRSGHSSSDAR